MGQRRNHKGNENVLWDKWEWRYNIPKLMGCSITLPRGKYIAVNTYVKKEEKSQISNLTFYFKTLEKEEQTQTKQKEGNNKD